MEPLESQQNTEKSRAKEIDSGTLPLSMQNVILGLPKKPGMTLADDSSSSCNEWSLTELISQKKLVTTLNVNEKSEGSIWQWQHTWKNVYSMHFRTFNELFLLKSWDVNFLFEFRSNFQQVGMFNIVYYNCPEPLVTYLQAGYTNAESFHIQTQLPHRLVAMGEDQNCTVTLKWNSPLCSSLYYGKIEEMDDYNMGTLKLFVPFKMQTATGVDSVMTVRIWSYLTNLKYGAYQPDDKLA